MSNLIQTIMEVIGFLQMVKRKHGILLPDIAITILVNWVMLIRRDACIGRQQGLPAIVVKDSTCILVEVMVIPCLHTYVTSASAYLSVV